MSLSATGVLTITSAQLINLENACSILADVLIPILAPDPIVIAPQTALSNGDYKNQLQALLPPGPAWSTGEATFLTRLLDGLAVELVRIDERAQNLANELDPRTTSEMFTDWERAAGLPDACSTAFGGEPSLVQRRMALVERLTGLNGQTPDYFIAAAAALGYTIKITEGSRHTVGSDVNKPLYDSAWASNWVVHTSLETVHPSTVMSMVTEPLACWGNMLLECAMKRLAPAHTVVLFSYA